MRRGRGETGFNCRPGDTVDGRYRVVSEAGAGNFARVVRAQDTQRNDEMVAIKILRKEYQRDASFEREVLQAINQKDPQQREKVAHMRAFFQWEGLPCFRFKLYGPNLKSRRFGPSAVSRPQLALLARQLGRTLHFFHFEARLVHTDLKPENILCDDSSVTAADGLGRGWTICDLGSASFYGPKPDQDLISTRPYRGPEVVLGCPWSYASDMWSFGCIIYEAARGRKLFDVSSDEQHLHLFQRKLGALPSWLVRNATPRQRSAFFDSSGRLQPMGPQSRPLPSGSIPLADELQGDPELLDLLMQCFQYDPACRLRADEVAHHPFVANNSPAPAGGPAPMISRTPQSGYTSGAIRTPGTELMRDCVPLSAAQKAQLSRRSGSPSKHPVGFRGAAADSVTADRIAAPPLSGRPSSTGGRLAAGVTASALAAAESHLRSARDSQAKLRHATPTGSMSRDSMYQTSSQAYGAASGRRGSGQSQTSSAFPALNHQIAAGVRSGRRESGHML
eukprot:TRINITY_DN13_c0_g2_i1.p1 TRINITY_DN13_c0_g2~~TRINITY_DN13_c0_g2_i1.p1  ORF type:complete len:506 (+),score=168.88 TRINITY_DN13_c0_g2_i1:101-1618(+)